MRCSGPLRGIVESNPEGGFCVVALTSEMCKCSKKHVPPPLARMRLVKGLCAQGRLLHSELLGLLALSL